MVYRRHAEDAPVEHPEADDLGDDRERLHDEEAADDGEQEIQVEQQAQRGRARPDRERSGVAHDDLGRRRVPPEEADTRSGQRHGDQRQVDGRGRQHVVDRPCRKIQYPMIARTAKQKVDDPAARPSTPSVRLTALEVPTMTTTAKITHPTCPSSIPGTVIRVNDSAVEVWAQCSANSAKSTPNRPGPRFGPLVEPEAALVAHLDPVVEEADQAEGHHGHHGQIPRS